MNAYLEAAKLMALVERAGARHSASDNALIQQAHDILMGLGATCQCEEMGQMMTVEQLRHAGRAPNPLLKAAVEALVLRHPGHPNQKVHGNRREVSGEFRTPTSDEETILKFRKQGLGRKYNRASTLRIANAIRKLPGGTSRLGALGEATTYGNVKGLRKLAKSGQRGISQRAREILGKL